MSDSPITMRVGDKVKIRGTSRVYIGTVISSEPNRISVRIGDQWLNDYEFVNGNWRPVQRARNRKAPRTAVVGLLA